MMDISIGRELQMKAQVAQESHIPNRSCSKEWSMFRHQAQAKYLSLASPTNTSDLSINLLRKVLS